MGFKKPKPRPPLKSQFAHTTNPNFSIGSLPPVGSHRTDPFGAQDTPAIWRCAYCDRENYGDRLTCAGCQAGRPREAEDAGLEIRVFGGDSVVLHGVRKRWEEKYRGLQNSNSIVVLDSGASYHCGMRRHTAFLAAMEQGK